MSDDPVRDVTLGDYLHQVLSPFDIDVTIVPAAQNEAMAYLEHLRITPVNQVDLSKLKEIVSHYYGVTNYSIFTTEEDGRHLKLRCVLGPVDLEVNCAFNFEGEEHYEITVA